MLGFVQSSLSFCRIASTRCGGASAETVTPPHPGSARRRQHSLSGFFGQHGGCWLYFCLRAHVQSQNFSVAPGWPYHRVSSDGSPHGWASPSVGSLSTALPEDGFLRIRRPRTTTR